MRASIPSSVNGVRAAVVSLLLTMVLPAGPATAEFLIDAPDRNIRGVVIRIEWPEDLSPTNIHRVRLSNGLLLPAAVHDAQLVFVVPEIRAGQALSGQLEGGLSREEPRVAVESDENSSRVSVFSGGELLTRYWHSADSRKPYLWPLNTSGAVGLTRDWPMGERVKTRDHEHHQSVWTAYGDVNGAGYWEYNERTGWQLTESVESGSGHAHGWITASNVWVDANHAPVVRERREFRFYSGNPERQLVDIDVTLTADYGPVHFEDTKEGGFIALRMRDELRERGGSGTITNSEGGVGAAECWGKPAAWLDYSGPLAGHGVRGVAVFDHPTSFRHPTYWHARNYGLVGANPFGLSDFTDGELNGDYTLPEGESISFRYRLLLHTGDVNDANVSEYYAGFANPPAARWKTAMP